ncbi:uncharacterized protein LOC120430530 [Culex pipiens pallens]|uniref:uncharacterized protein LOC120430530 n=1 Tax=Culex pipiens pallens TaxID=42434 RepID=UPI001954E09A|nr:uncharacterized protein LOC120430530 [Culex pipiens pallens]
MSEKSTDPATGETDGLVKSDAQKAGEDQLTDANKDKTPFVGNPLTLDGDPLLLKHTLVSYVKPSCCSCRKVDDSLMVQCDTCDAWHHNICVGVSDEVMYDGWLCPKCESAKAAQTKKKTKKDAQQKKTSSTKDKKPKKEDKISKDQKKVAKSDRQTRGRKKADETKPAKVEKCTKHQKSAVEKRSPIDARSIVSGTSRRSEMTVLELQLKKLEAEQTLVEEEMRRKKEILQKKFSVLEQIAEAEERRSERESIGGKQLDSVSKVTSWLGGHASGSQRLSKSTSIRSRKKSMSNSSSSSSSKSESLTTSSSESSSQSTASETSSAESTSSEEESGQKRPSDGSSSLGKLERFKPKKKSTPKKKATSKKKSAKFSSRRQSKTSRNPSSLTRDQIAARQVVPRDLPKFTGNPEDWPMFLSTYESTTKMCGYTDEENMIRLRNCLRDDALNTAQNSLMHPSTVSKAIGILKLRFGQPQMIINSLKAKVLGMPAIQPDAMDKLIEHALAVQNLCGTIEACGKNEYKRDVTLLSDLVGKLPPTLKLDWARYQRGAKKVNLFVYSDWIYAIAEDACLVYNAPGTSKKNDPSGNVRSKAFVNTHSDHSSPEVPKQTTLDPNRRVNRSEGSSSGLNKCCPICQGECKSAAKCSRFLELSYDARWSAVRELKMCRKCLRQHYGSCDAKPCGKNGCTFKHHELLHKDLRSTDEPKQSSSGPTREESNVNTHLSSSGARMFRYLPVTLHGQERKVDCYAFLDDGSELTLIDQDLVEELGVSGTSKPLCLKWTGGTHRYEADSRSVDVVVSGHSNQKFNLDGVRTVKELKLPIQSLDAAKWKSSFPHLRDIPVASYENAQPRLLIGLKHASVALVRKSREGKEGEPIAVKTRLGWTVYGGSSNPVREDNAYPTYHVCECNPPFDESLHQAVKNFFSIESLGIYKPDKLKVSKQEERAQTLLRKLTRLDGERYETGLLWRYDNARLPDSKPMAMQRLTCLERRLERDPELAQVLHEKMLDYKEKGYIRKLSAEELAEQRQRKWYLPIFPVVNPNKPGKVRIVWDAAATAHGISLNSMLLTGPDELTSLPAVLCQFRERRVAICGDIREMFHQVRIRPDDQHCLRFLWRERPDEEPSTFVMQDMTFGACCSPSSAQFAKNQNAERFREQYPKATEAIIKNHYVDDMLASEETEEAAIELAEAVRHVHAEGGFEIRNWLSNSPRVLTALQGENVVQKDLNLAPELATEKVLGMWWDTSKDCFTFKVSRLRFDEALLNGTRRPTKNEVLSVLMSIFDPLGLISNYLMQLKIILQDVWRSGVKWGEQIKDKQFEAWKSWVKLLPFLEKVSVPRCFRQEISAKPEVDVQLHCFVDASENGMSANVYLRFEEEGKVECAMLCAKTRVAPLKFLSIPRLELMAAVIGVRLVNSLASQLTIPISKLYFWSVSRNVLAWLRSDHRRYSPFVAARVSEILETTEECDWRWVPTKLNVADEGTKWQRQPDFSPNSRWFRGPEFLLKAEGCWPQQPCKSGATDEELRPSFLFHGRAFEWLVPVTKFSSWKRLVRVTAYAKRFIVNFQRRVSKAAGVSGALSSAELRNAEEYLFRGAQRDAYADEVCLLEQEKEQPRKQIPKTSRIYKLSPFLDDRGVLRMRGRVDACEFLLEDAKNPIILPKDHPVTTLILTHYHEEYHHRNYATVQNEVRQRFYISHLRAALRQTRSKCQECENRDSVPKPPRMSDLPHARLAAFEAPFSHVGVDYFGPIEVILGRRVEKRWGVLLTCLTTRAVHLEIAHSLSTGSCIMALRNFMVRRGIPRTFYSDNGTNFIGSNRELREAYKTVDQEKLMQEFTTVETEWRFIPPAAPHMGGSWERLIQTVKRNLEEIVGNRRPNEEELRNALIEVEGVLNARPLTHVPVDAESAPALTPNHFLLGSSNGTKPLTLLDNSAAAVRRGCTLSQVMANQFWRRWIRDYLPEITRRSKWYQNVKPIEVGDIVVIADSNHPRNCWPKGRVIGTVNRDGQVRRATVQTAKGIYERPAVKLAVLDVRSEKE